MSGTCLALPGNFESWMADEWNDDSMMNKDGADQM